MDFLSGLQGALFFMGGVVATGVIGYHVLEGYTWLEALYMTVMTLSTVGFREVRPLGPTGQIFTILLIIAGLGVVFLHRGRRRGKSGGGRVSTVLREATHAEENRRAQ